MTTGFLWQFYYVILTTKNLLNGTTCVTQLCDCGYHFDEVKTLNRMQPFIDKTFFVNI